MIIYFSVSPSFATANDGTQRRSNDLKTKRSLKRVLSLPVCRYQRTRRNWRFSICNCRLKIMFFRNLGRAIDSIARRLQRIGLALASLRQQRNARAAPHSGDNSAVAPPVPIPNTAVKRCSPDGSTAIGRARVGRRQNKMPGEFISLGILLSGTSTRAENTPCWEAGG